MPVPDFDFDVAILGGGMGGYPAAIRASQLGMKVALVEAAKLGGTCLHIGCIPTKALLESSELYHRVAARGVEFGLKAEVVGFDYPKIAERRDAVVTKLYQGVQFLMKKNKIEVVQADLQALAAERSDPCLDPASNVDQQIMPGVSPAAYYRGVDRYGDPVAGTQVRDRPDFDAAEARLRKASC